MEVVVLIKSIYINLSFCHFYTIHGTCNSKQHRTSEWVGLLHGCFMNDHFKAVVHFYKVGLVEDEFDVLDEFSSKFA